LGIAEDVMGKLSQMYRKSAGPSPRNRIIIMLALMVAILVSLVVLRGRLGGPSDVGGDAEVPFAPEKDLAPKGLDTKISGEGDNMALSVGETHLPAAPGADNAILAAPSDDNNPFAGVVDGEKFLWAEQDAFYRAVEMAWKLQKYAPEEAPPVVNRRSIYASLERYRGKLVRVQGRLLVVGSSKYDEPNKEARARLRAAGLEDWPRQYYQCAIGNVKDGYVIVYVFGDPTEQGLKPGRDDVRVDGYFFKVLYYMGEDRKEKYAPILFGYELVQVPRPPAPALNVFGTVIIAVLGGLAVVIYVFLRVSRQRGGAVRRKLEEEIIEEAEIPEPTSLPGDEEEMEDTDEDEAKPSPHN
jgi:hypothetical protein